MRKSFLPVLGLALAICLSGSSVKAQPQPKPTLKVENVTLTLGATKDSIGELLTKNGYTHEPSRLLDWDVMAPNQPVARLLGRLQFTENRLTYAEKYRDFSYESKPAELVKALYSILEPETEFVLVSVYPPYVSENLVARTISFALPDRTLNLSVRDFSAAAGGKTFVDLEESIGQRTPRNKSGE